MLATATMAPQAPSEVRDRSVVSLWRPGVMPGKDDDRYETEYGWRRTRQFTFALRHCDVATVASLKDSLSPSGFRRIPGTSGSAPPDQRRCWLSDLLTLLRPEPCRAYAGPPAAIGVTLLQLGELASTPLFQSPLISSGAAAVSVIRLLTRHNLVIESIRVRSRQGGCVGRLDLMKPGDTVIYDPARIAIGTLSCIRPDTRVPGSANIMCLALGDSAGSDYCRA
jgi:hypothetical protein